MSARPPPRKGRSRGNNHSYNNGGSRESAARYAQQSDYDSDAINSSYAVQPSDAENRMYDPKNYVPEVDGSATYAHTTRTNYELNMSVLKRYVSGLRAILLTCSFVRLYEWSPTTNSWELRDVEGPMFLCECDPIVLPNGHELPQTNLFVLNRRSMENLTINLSKVEMYEATNEKFLSLMMEADEAGPGRALGFHLHSTEEKEAGDSQGQCLVENPDWGLIEEHWVKARAALSAANNQVVGAHYEQSVPSNGSAVADYAQAPAPWASLGAFSGNGEGIYRNTIMTPTKSSRLSESSSLSSATDLPENLVQAVQTQLGLISSFRLWLDNHTPIGCNASTWSKVNSKLVSHVEKYRSRIGDMQSKFPGQIPLGREDQDGAIPEDVWKLRVRQEKSDGLVLTVAIGSDDLVKVNFDSREELESAMGDKYFGYITKVFQFFEQAERDLVQLFRMAREIALESSALDQPPEETVQKHIDLLTEYNDMKDIGQQLIGLIADNKGVSIGALYEDGQYGVTADD
ncbi:Swi5-domain-containing protein [Pseudoneurospora amorphoporcata]|uniref:Swi5-domain-containing protein n=1 Tax=Pseudoneurospora amorphoporcata TaxID=241081 RepID=A0AAN6P3K5_9PEZI|nr:Swi5-domain-containing protein [Pseudoneurospora amorphoporcata]